MQVQSINFRGMINIIGKDSNLYINHDSVESISTEKYLDTQRDDGDESIIGMKIKQGTYINLTSGNKIKVFAPLEEVLGAYKQSSDADVNIKTKYNPLFIEKTLINSL